ncbi:hemerythrin domain-containing protein [Pseudoduganella umbonata]|uniref:Hemerythrin domain-containing protein n=1 Tax=Pseudoduganella umbonata TaxID=864828 RepID=A0A4P8HNC6_9BURK|nr:hemerythrin domain-containing protein [Pseudoduganella umbonata]MBB3224433.1 hemerythrin superfamily protein [Pseudoduganella umbonata]QCP11209.1 hemerythrin domain-containing protein [Pseudoduganella umbonata]
MPVTNKSTQAIKNATPLATGAIDAIALLKADHEKVKDMFERFEGLSDRAVASKKKLVREICLELTKHAEAEEEIFYSAVRKAVGDEDMVDEATVEHACAKDLIAQLLAMEPGDDLYDAKVKVLSEQIEHHVEEEEKEMFPKAKKSGLDMIELGQAIQARKEEIGLPLLN